MIIPQGSQVLEISSNQKSKILIFTHSNNAVIMNMRRRLGDFQSPFPPPPPGVLISPSGQFLGERPGPSWARDCLAQRSAKAEQLKGTGEECESLCAASHILFRRPDLPSFTSGGSGRVLDLKGRDFRIQPAPHCFWWNAAAGTPEK